ncbi:MAG: (2Fe-2S)-binding protein [Solirubrobacterales bacterium]|nr:(2Fe-2S)-binding protein [Solirubrobacterales bacterium]MBV9801146.1 (2Fe-2S)-binding protein [Solirubrobacterales bacterium]
MSPSLPVRISVNGRWREGVVEPRRTLADFLREDLGLKGAHLACEHGFCGNCNVLFDGHNVRSCLMLAVQANGHAVETVEGLARDDGELDDLQRAFTEHAAIQCGFCTPAMLLTAKEFLREHPGETDEVAIRRAISGVTCRCTGYQQIVEAIRSVAAATSERAAEQA